MKALARALPALALLPVVAAAGGPAAAATSWSVTLHSSSAGEGHAQALPAAPASPSAACTSSGGKTITVSWSAVTHAATYSVYDSTTSATGTFSLVASGVTTTSWTSGALATGNYWFEVTATIGTNWAGARSSATGESTIGSTAPHCSQP
jgi:hypothetical protein